MNDNQLKAAIARALEEKGYQVELIPEDKVPTPDIQATNSHETLIIEIKEKRDTEPLHKKTEAVRLDPIARRNRLSGIVAKAVKQLTTISNNDAFKLLWIYVADPYEQHFVYEQFRSTLYGIRYVAGNKNGEPVEREGYYINNSDFHQQRAHLDGVVLGNFEGLFLNDLSPRYSRLRSSYFRDLFEMSVLDPLEMEKKGDIFYLDTAVDRHDEVLVKQALEEKYGFEIGGFTNLVRLSFDIDWSNSVDI